MKKIMIIGYIILEITHLVLYAIITDSNYRLVATIVNAVFLIIFFPLYKMVSSKKDKGSNISK